jgi:hypothetical protein
VHASAVATPAAEYLPAPQLRQSEALSLPVTLTDLPVEHSIQLEAWSLLVGLCIPDGHVLQYLAPNPTPVPSLSLLELVANFPAAQVLQLVPPEFWRTLPDGHGLQYLAPNPTPFPSLSLLELVANFPAAQVLQLVPPEFWRCLPDGHDSQYMAPVVTPVPSWSGLDSVANFPAAHILQLLSPDG